MDPARRVVQGRFGQRAAASALISCLVASFAFAACGGQRTTEPTPADVPVEGTYSGVMTFSDDHSRTTATTTVSRAGDTVSFTPLSVAQTGGTYTLGSAALLSDGSFSGASSYVADVCGPIACNYEGRFRSRVLHLKVSLAATSPPAGAWCSPFALEGDLSQ